MNAIAASVSPRTHGAVSGQRRRGRKMLLLSALVVGLGVSTSASAWIDYAALAQRAVEFIQTAYRQSYNDAYNTRLTYLHSVQDRLTQKAINGDGNANLANKVIGGAAEYGALATALGVAAHVNN